MIFGKCVTNQLSLFINDITIGRTSEVVLVGITIDDQLTFKTHIKYMSTPFLENNLSCRITLQYTG